jgi:very-short-patch-repair endonuclease
MRPLPRELFDIARSQRGLITASQLTEHKVVGRARTDALASGLLVPVHRGVHRINGQPETFEQRCLAACLAAPGAAVSGPTAGRLLRLRKVHTEEVHVIATRAIELGSVTAHRTDLLSPADVASVDGIPALRPARLLCDLAAHLDQDSLESVLEQMLARRLVSIPAVRAMAKRFVGPGRPGSVRLGRVLDARSDWLRPAESDLELRVWRRLASRGLMMERQVEVVADSGRRYRLDLAAPAIRFGIEVDHVTWHGGRLDVQADKRRDRELTHIGWLISRVTDDDLAGRFDATLDQLIGIADVRRRGSETTRIGGATDIGSPAALRGFRTG